MDRKPFVIYIYIQTPDNDVTFFFQHDIHLVVYVYVASLAKVHFLDIRLPL